MYGAVVNSYVPTSFAPKKEVVGSSHVTFLASVHKNRVTCGVLWLCGSYKGLWNSELLQSRLHVLCGIHLFNTGKFRKCGHWFPGSCLEKRYWGEKNTRSAGKLCLRHVCVVCDLFWIDLLLLQAGTSTFLILCLHSHDRSWCVTKNIIRRFAPMMFLFACMLPVLTHWMYAWLKVRVYICFLILVLSLSFSYPLSTQSYHTFFALTNALSYAYAHALTHTHTHTHTYILSLSLSPLFCCIIVWFPISRSLTLSSLHRVCSFSVWGCAWVLSWARFFGRNCCCG